MTAPLTETVWTPGRHPTLDAAALTPDQQAGDAYTPDRMWAAYFQSAPPQVVMSLRFAGRDEDFPTLSDYLNQLLPTSLMDHLFTVDSYRNCRILGEPLPTKENRCFTPDPIVDEILAPSKGILLWKHQFEQLAQICGLPRPEAIKLRRRVNQKRPTALMRLRNMTLPSEQSLQHVTFERLLYEGTVPGQWSAAKLLQEMRIRPPWKP